MMRPRLEFLLIVCVFFSLLCSPAVKAEKNPYVEDGGERVDLIITYTRQETPKEDVAANVVVVTREEIEKIPASNAAEVLQYVPGVYVEFNGGLGSQAVASIQGSDFRHVAVYQDGVPLNMLANPTTDLSFIPAATIERIEVYKGAASSSWGSALGGVINIITREPDLLKPFTGEIQSSYGEFDTFRNSGTVSGTAGRFGYLLSLTHDETDGAAFHSRLRQDAAYAKFNYFLGETSRLNFVSSYSDGRNESPIALLTGFYDFFEEFHRTRSYQRLLYETTLSRDVAFTIEGRHHQFSLDDDYVRVRSRTEGWRYDEERWGISSRLSHKYLDINHLVVGFDGDWGEFDFSSYADRSPSGNWALYANDTVNLGPFSFIAGLRYDDNIDFGSELSPLAGAVYRFPWKEALIRAQVARGFSAPPGSLLHDPIYGNKNLKAETGINYQAGGEIRPLEFLKFEVNLFQSDIDNLLFWNPDVLKYENIAEVTRRGIEGRVGTAFTSGALSGLALSFGGSYIDVRDGKTGEVINDIPRVLFDASASYTYKRISQSIIGRYIDNNSTFPETHDEVFVFDYLIKVNLPSLPCLSITPSIFGAVHDFTDSGYLYRSVFPQPGRWVEGGLKFEF